MRSSVLGVPLSPQGTCGDNVLGVPYGAGYMSP